MNNAMRYYNGLIDEVRISDTARSADWIAAQYLSTSDSFITYEGQENLAKTTVTTHQLPMSRREAPALPRLGPPGQPKG